MNEQSEGTNLVKAFLPAAEADGFFVAKKQPLALVACHSGAHKGCKNVAEKGK